MKQLTIAKKAALRGGKIIRSSKITEVNHKEGAANFVTNVDHASQRAIIDVIRRSYPEHHILSEEEEHTVTDLLKLPNLWIVDPLDGTVNFLYGKHLSATSVAYVERGIIKAGTIYDPYHDELFFAEKGKSAWLRSGGRTQKLQVRAEKHLDGETTVATDNSHERGGTAHNLRTLLQLKQMPRIYVLGSAVLALAHIAAGRLHLYFHTYLFPWDCAAGMLLVEEAGGVVRDLKGEKITFLADEIVMGNAALVAQFIRQIRH